MSSKTKKTVTSSSNISVVSSVQSPQQSSTPVGSRPASSTGRPSSPLSPTRHTRLQEKDALQNLNDRLAAYIDKVRQLESENSGLRREIQTTQEVVTREVSNIKGIYEHELQDARKLLDDTSREKAKLEIDLKRLYEENDDLKKRLDKKTKDCQQAENLARHYETRFTEESNKYNTALADKKKAQDEARELAKELEKLRKVYADTRKTLEEEMLCRIDMENTVQSLREELSFKDQVFQQELQETRTRRQVEISEIDGRLAQQYEAKLQQSLQELREQQEANVKANREEIEALYENKMKNLQSAANRNNNAATVAVEELRTMRTRIDTLNAQLNELENKNAALSNRCRELERQLESERARHAEDLASLEQELARLRDEMAAQLREYATLMDIKISLDLEIATYRTLLEGEEDRLNLTSQSPGRESRASASGISVSGGARSTPGRRATPLRAARKRTLLDESEERSLNDFSVTSSAKGDLEVAEVCPDGTYVKIRNKGKKELSLGGYQIVRKAGDQETIFKFHRTVKLEPGAVSTVWSADVGADHEPPHDIVMKGQKWFVADRFTTVLLNNELEEIAISERQRAQVSTRAQRHRELAHKYPRREQLPNDMDNFMEYHVMGSVSQVRMKPGCMPTKFECQSYRRKRMSNTTERPYILKKQRKTLIEECIKDLEESSITTKYLKLGETSSGSSVSHGNQKNITQKHKTANKLIQVHMTHNFRSKAIQTEIKLVNQMTSPLKPNLQSVSTSPFKISRCSSTIKPSSLNLHNPSRKILAIEDQSDSDISYTPSVMHRESSPSTTSDCSELMQDDKKQEASQILKYTLLKIIKNPRSYNIGVVKNCYYLIGLIEENTNISATHILMCLKKIRLNNPFRELADDFSITPTYASKIFLKNVPLLASVMRPFIVKLNKDSISNNLPMAFRHKYHNVSCIIDCLEIEIQKPSKSLNQSLSWSEYKKANTVKYLISCTPNGLVNYISPGYGGRITDTCLVESCDFIKCLQPGMCVMADRGFKHVESYLLKHGVKLVRPPSVTTGAKLSKTEARETKQIASLRIHVERVIRRVREFNMLKPHACVNHNLLKILDDVITIACGLINLQDSLIK